MQGEEENRDVLKSWPRKDVLPAVSPSSLIAEEGKGQARASLEVSWFSFKEGVLGREGLCVVGMDINGESGLTDA